ncbi:MAG TPA: extracellular solute-binding protein [Rubrobacter sp.]|nr:extracellular solute-binding protein [Rubrobacter sp.]
MQRQHRISRGHFLRLSAMVAGGAMLAGCSIEEGGGPPGAKKGGGGEVDISKIQAEQSPELKKLAENWKPYDGPDVELSIWMYAQDPASLKAYKKAFEKEYSNITLKYVTYPEENYQTKVNVALQAHNPPDIAIMEDRAWMKANLTADLAPFYKAWGINVKDFAPGGVARFTLEDGPQQGIFGVGDFLGGNIIVYNKDLFDEAGADYPPTDSSLEWPEYADLARKVARPNTDPNKRVYGCSAPDWGFGIWQRWVFGPDGRKILGNLNSEPEIEAWNLGTALVRDKIAPSGQVTTTVAEPDLFTQKRIAMTWTDFTYVKDYNAANINFGIAPWPVIQGSESFVDTWTAPWGTFVESEHLHAALTFLQFMGTEAQRIRAQVSADPPLSLKVAREIDWSKGDPLKEEYLKVLEVAAQAQPFVPPLPEGGYVSTDVYNKMTVQGQTDAAPILDDEAKKTQPLLDKAWKDWEALA